MLIGAPFVSSKICPAEFPPTDILYIKTDGGHCEVKLVADYADAGPMASSIDHLMFRLFDVLTAESGFEDEGA